MKLQLFGKEDLEVEASLLFKDRNHILLKITKNDKFEENIDVCQYASSFKFDTVVGDIIERNITTRQDCYILRIEFE